MFFYLTSMNYSQTIYKLLSFVQSMPSVCGEGAEAVLFASANQIGSWVLNEKKIQNKRNHTVGHQHKQSSTVQTSACVKYRMEISTLVLY